MLDRIITATLSISKILQGSGGAAPGQTVMYFSHPKMNYHSEQGSTSKIVTTRQHDPNYDSLLHRNTVVTVRGAFTSEDLMEHGRVTSLLQKPTE